MHRSELLARAHRELHPLALSAVGGAFAPGGAGISVRHVRRHTLGNLAPDGRRIIDYTKVHDPLPGP